MIPSTQSWYATPGLAKVERIHFWIGQGYKDNEFLKRYPLVDDTAFDVVVEPTDNLSLVNLEFCAGKEVWIEAQDSEGRRGNILFKRLTAKTNEYAPRSVFAPSPMGLFVWNSKTRSTRRFGAIMKDFNKGAHS